MSKAGLWPTLGLAIRLVAAGIWLFAGIAKLFDLEHFRTQVAAYKLLPHALVTPFAYGLPFVETFVGLYLLLGLLVVPVAILSCVLMAAFLIAQAQAWGGETICARTAVAAATSRSARVSGSSASAGAKPSLTI